MSNTIALLDKARELCKPPTYYRLAMVLDINQATISAARKKGFGLDAAAIHKLAALLEQDYDEVMALVQLDREQRPNVRAYWEKIAPRLVPSLVIGVLAAAGLGVSGPSHSARSDEGSAVYRAIHYAKYTVRWLLSVLGWTPAPAGSTA